MNFTDSMIIRPLPENTSISMAANDAQEIFIADEMEPLVASTKTSKHPNLLKGLRNELHSTSQTHTIVFANPPATEDTLNIDGVTVYVYVAPNGETLYIPVGLMPESGQPGDISHYTPSEAWGYALRNAVEAGDRDLFEKFVKSYLYFCNQSVIARGEDDAAFGIMGWSPDMTTGSYAKLPFATSASDADEDIISALIDGYKQFGDMTITDAITDFSSPNIHTSISLKDLALEALKSFIDHDLGSLTLDGKTYEPVMTLDNWGNDLLFPDYFDPIIFAKMINFLADNNGGGQYSSEIDTLKNAATNTMQYIFDIAEASGGWIPDTSDTIPAGAGDFGYDAVRILMRLGQFIATDGAESIFGKEVFDQAVEVLKNLTANIIPLCYEEDGTYVFPPSGLSEAQFTGPLLLALAALNKIGQLPEGVTEDTIATVFQCFTNTDLENYNIQDGTKGWQKEGYFNIQLGVLCEAIMKDLHIYPEK